MIAVVDENCQNEKSGDNAVGIAALPFAHFQKWLETL